MTSRLLVLLCIAMQAAAQAPGYEIHPDYIVDQFTTDDGLPSPHVTGVAADPDGYLWITTLGGLARFDGQSFTTFRVADTPTLRSDRLAAPFVTADGVLWIRTEPGDVIRYDGRTFQSLRDLTGMDGPLSLQVDGQGQPWILTEDGLWTWADGAPRRMWPAVVQGRVGGVYHESDEIWVVTESNVLRLSEGVVRARYPVPSTWSAGWISRAASGEMWLSTPGSPAWLQDGRFRRLTSNQDPALTSRRRGETGGWDTAPAVARALGDAQPKSSNRENVRTGASVVPRVDEGPQGASWRILEGWVFRDRVPVYHLGEDAQLSAGTYVPFALDRTGALWVGGRTLHRVRRRAVQVVSAEEGLGGRNVYPVLAATDGSVWVGLWYQDADLARIVGTRATTVPMGDRVFAVTALMEDRDGTVWAATNEGTPYGAVYQIRDGRPRRIEIVAESEETGGIGAITQRRDGSIWIGGTTRLARGTPTRDGWRWTSQPIAFKVNALVETSDGEMLIASGGGGLGRALPGERFEWLATGDGLASDQVRDVHQDERGVLWIATEDRGLCRLDRAASRSLLDGDLECLSTDDGLFHDSLHRILADDQGRLWVNSNGGIFAFDRAQADSVATGLVDRLHVLALTEADGLRDAEGNGSMQPAGSRSADGRLWFPTQDGVVVFDPASMSLPPPPTAHIERVDGGERAGDTVVLAPGERDVRVEYAAVELPYPERVRYRVRLEGYDDDWREVGERREAAFTNLPAGDYTLRVQARTTGAWGPEARLTVRRQPLVWETGWFRALIALAALGAIAGLVWLRIRVLERRQRELEHVVASRTADLRRANEVKSRFLANVSHELRTPLTLLLGPLRDLRRGRFGVAPEATPLLERAEINGTRLERLIADLLALSRIDAGGLDLSLERFELVAFAHARVSAFGSRPASLGVDLSVDADGPLWVVADPAHLETIIYNLVDNAIRFTPRGGRVAVQVEADGGGARLAVRDTGAGIGQEDLVRLFERFYQADTEFSRAGIGTGIGLALVREVVEMHGGTVRAESTPGAGTVVSVQIPALPLPASAAPSASPDAMAPPPLLSAFASGDGQLGRLPELTDDERPVVLVVEDHPDLRAYLRALLEPTYLVEEAPDGVAGIERAVEIIPDVIVSDVSMPRADGFEVLAAVKADARTSHVPVVMLTARADAESRLAGFGAGADAYVDKPFDAAELEARVAGLIENRRRLWQAWGARPDEPEAPALPPAEADFLARVDGRIAERLADGAFGATQLAGELGLSERQLRRKLKAVTGETPGARMRRLRIEAGAALLAAGTHTIKEAAAATGYADAEGFRRAFVSVRGEQPSEVQAQPSEATS